MGCKDVKTAEKPLPQPAPVHDSLPPAPSQANAKARKTFEPYVSEQYADSTQIGIKGKNKVELKVITSPDTMYADIRFYAKENQKWIEKQHLTWPYEATACNPKYADFNNDGHNDFTFKTINTARGGNDARILFMYNKQSGLLKPIKNSDNYSNLHYNNRLNCIDAWALHGGTTTSFLSIDADTLHLFASVNVFDGQLEVHRYNKNGKETLIQQKAYNEDFPRFKNFDPLEEYTEADFK
ncbi:hypothetical protein AM493_14350 [Flavobacterium akiainvivens]|uniref:Uncharacterized protein n=2 Tax=Flavobacterium akiainvivens TaxID=1202724 RepID=A0A0M8MAK9_9FLAO|nr:hypothetical protein AM493_14350 [Flavobacterium akiainvivens]